jgi:hypothetical protein
MPKFQPTREGMDPNQKFGSFSGIKDTKYRG